MKNMEPDSTLCPALKSFIDYWDQWHKQWYLQVKSTPQKLTSINGWPIPEGNGGNTNDIWRYFPEPYWGNPSPTELTAVFLNLNPGGGGNDQDVLTSTNDPIATYNTNNQVYSDTVRDLINNPHYPTTDWFIKKRVLWINCLLNSLGKPHNKTIENIIAGDLVPWHTKTISEIRNYIKANIPLIDQHCIKPLAEISQCASLKGVVFSKGAEIAHALGNKATQVACYTADKYRICIYEYNEAVFIVFIGGQGMNLPQPIKIYRSSITQNDVTVTDVVNGCLSHNYV